MLVCVAASGERCCGADLLAVGFETCFEREPRGSETHYYACAHVFEVSEIASERASAGGIVVVSYRIVGLELATCE
jgi:hypothetical protein